MYQDKKVRIQISKIRNERWEITIDSTEIQRIVRKCYEQVFAIKLKCLNGMSKFLETHNSPQLNLLEQWRQNKN